MLLRGVYMFPEGVQVYWKTYMHTEIAAYTDITQPQQARVRVMRLSRRRYLIVSNALLQLTTDEEALLMIQQQLCHVKPAHVCLFIYCDL